MTNIFFHGDTGYFWHLRTLQFALSGFAPHLTSHFDRSVSRQSEAMLWRMIDKTISPVTKQIPDTW
ncbi:MAG: hypothetical protein WBS20_00485 [Lysobacterales bacterium]